MQDITSIEWVATSQVNNENISVQTCNSTIDSEWRFVTQGTDINGNGFQATSAIVDNMTNGNPVTIVYGPQSYQISPYTRRTFYLPTPTPWVQIDITSGICTLTLCQSDMQVPDEQNQLASSGGSGGVAEYNPYFQCTGQTPVADELLYTHTFERAVQYQNNFNGSVAAIDPVAGVDPAGTFIAPVYNDGVLIGNITCTHAGVFSFETVGGVSGNFEVGQVLTVAAPHVPDGSILNFGVTFAMAPI